MSDTFLTVTEQTHRKGGVVFLPSVEVWPAHDLEHLAGMSNGYQGSRLLHAEEEDRQVVFRIDPVGRYQTG